MNWEPLVKDEDARNNILNKIREINTTITKNLFRVKQEGVVNGLSGLAIFYAYTGTLFDKEKSAISFERCIIKTLEKINRGNTEPTFSVGMPGVMWTIEHLKSHGFVELEDNSDDFFNWLSVVIEHTSVARNFDYLHGALGLIKTSLKYIDQLDKNYYTTFINNLEENVVLDNESYYWKSILYGTRGESFVSNLGLAHGLPGTLIVLSELYQQTTNERLLGIISKGIDYLLSTKYKESNNSLYPSFIYENDTAIFPGESEGGRLAWCYGDLCIAVSLLRVGYILKRNDLIDEAIVIAKYSSSRRDLNDVKIYDAGFCHGSIGLAHIYNRLYQYTKMEELKEAALFWTDIALKQGSYQDGYAGFKTFVPEKGHHLSLNLLEGIAGVGLVLTSLISDIEPKWDEFFLLSNYDQAGNDI
jgi:lantibiotic biosynthesis protein